MLNVLYALIAITYLVIIVTLYVFGANTVYLGCVAWLRRHSRLPLPPATVWPRVTVQIPMYNERYVAERVLEAASRLEYPPELLEIQVLDDSTDETVELVHNAVQDLRDRGVNAVHLRRAHRTGYKAGALAAGLVQALGEFVAIFDSDAVPPADFLKRTIPHFQNPRVAFVQTRWGYLNRDHSMLTFLQALQLDAQFMIWQFARFQGGYWFNFNGSGGVWRRAAIEDAGGWSAETLTEDKDLSYRAFLRGWRAVYLRDVEVETELPVSFSAYRRQRHRWARGTLECARKLTVQMWKAPLSLPTKLVETLHLTADSVHLLLCAVALLFPTVLFLPRGYSGLLSLFGIGFIFNITTFAPALSLLIAQKQLHRPWWRLLPVVLLVTPLGASMMLNTVWAAVQTFRRQSAVFERTPKLGLANEKPRWTHRRYESGLDPIVFLELGFALFNFGSFLLAVHAGNWFVAMYAAMFCLSMMFASGRTILEAITPLWEKLRPEIQPLADAPLQR